MHKRLHIFSEGQRLLRELVFAEEYRTPATTIAEKCNVTVSAVSRWASGFLSPTPEQRAVMERRYKIPVDAWDAKPSKKTEGAS